MVLRVITVDRSTSLPPANPSSRGDSHAKRRTPRTTLENRPRTPSQSIDLINTARTLLAHLLLRRCTRSLRPARVPDGLLWVGAGWGEKTRMYGVSQRGGQSSLGGGCQSSRAGQSLASAHRHTVIIHTPLPTSPCQPTPFIPSTHVPLPHGCSSAVRRPIG